MLLMTVGESDLMDWTPADRLNESFPLAGGELIEAAKCLAMGRDPAAVFHSMNALESPLRVIARYFGVRFDSATSWGTAIGNIKDKIDAISRKAKRGKRKSE